MSALQRLNPHEDDGIWRQNASIMRQLYQEEKRTLKEVKEIMENEKGFPVTPISVWEIKLRELGMKKKLKAKDWSVVYQHVRPRLQHDGKKDLRKPTVFLINGTKKRWDDVWKEFRRNRALRQGPHRGLLPPLPPGIVIRTPSPELLESTLRIQQPRSSRSLLLQLFQTTNVSLKPLLGVGSQPDTEPNDALKYPDSVYRLCLQGTPFTELLDKISDTIHGDLSSPPVAKLGETQDEIQDNQVIPTLGPSNNRAAASDATPLKLQLISILAQPSSSTGQELSLDFDSHHYLFMMIYLLSNSHLTLDPDTDMSLGDVEDFMEIIFRFVSKRVLLALFQSRLPSIKAAWERLFRGAGYCKNQEAFRVLISAGMDNDWLEETARGHEYLYLAVRSNCVDLVDTLLARGCRADSSVALRHGPIHAQEDSAIVAALRNGALDCARLLIQNCDVNRRFEFFHGGKSSTNFVMFIAHFDGNSMCHRTCLDYFLEHGADVDCEISPDAVVHSFGQPYWRVPDAHFRLMEGWPLSILDFVYYFHRPVFPKLAVRSKASSLFNRARALWCLEQGVHVLREYLQEDLAFARPWENCIGEAENSFDVSERKKDCLEALLAEQFLLGHYGPVRNVCCTTVLGLLELGVDLKTLSTRQGLETEMLYATACLITSGKGPDEEKGLNLLRLLLDHGFEVQGDALSAAIENRGFQVREYGLSAAVKAHGVATLAILAEYCSDLKKHGAKALAKVVSNGDFEATKFLLDRVVDPNSTVTRIRGHGNTIFAAAALDSSLAMMTYLVQRGSRPRIWQQEGGPLKVLISFFLGEFTAEDLFVKAKYFIEEHITIADPSCPSAYLLELSLRGYFLTHDGHDSRRIFEYLLRKGAKLRPGSPLAEWIAVGGGHQLVREMLDAGADPDAFSFETPHGMDRIIHSGLRRQSPLQAAAKIGDYTLVCMLLERGADVNRPAVGEGGCTALQAICRWDPARPEERTRKDRIIKLLLAKGADVNAAEYSGTTAVLIAAELGDLSTAFVLLKHGAKTDAMCKDTRDDYKQTALDVAAENGRLDMVQFLLNANALSASAYTDGKHYDGAIQQARAGGHFVVAELICEHSRNRKRWDLSHGQLVETSVPIGKPHSLALRTNSGAFSSPKIEARLTLSGNLQAVPALDKTRGLCSAPDECIAEEATDVSETRVIEEIEDESPLADTGWEEPNGEENDGTANQALDTGRASPGPGEWLHQWRGQNWVEDGQQNIDPVVSTGLVADVFMGFSEFPSR